MRTRYQVPLLPSDVVVDNSTLASYLKCATRGGLEHALGLKPKQEGAALKQGQVGHVALAEWFEHGDAERALKAYSKGFKAEVEPVLAKLGPDDPDRARLAHARTRQILAEWFEARPRERFPLRIEPEDIELAISAPLMELKDGRRVVYVALLDALGTRRTGGRWSMDNKFTKAIKDYWKNKQEDSAQFTGQTWLWGEHGLGLAGVYVNGIEIPVAHTSPRKCMQHGVSYAQCDTAHVRHDLFPVTRSVGEVQAWLRTVRREIPRWVRVRDKLIAMQPTDPEIDPWGLKAIQQVSMEGRFNEACAFCGFREWCRIGRPSGGRGDWFVKEKWDPLAERRKGA